MYTWAFIPSFIFNICFFSIHKRSKRESLYSLFILGEVFFAFSGFFPLNYSIRGRRGNTPQEVHRSSSFFIFIYTPFPFRFHPGSSGVKVFFVECQYITLFFFTNHIFHRLVFIRTGVSLIVICCPFLQWDVGKRTTTSGISPSVDCKRETIAEFSFKVDTFFLL